MKFLNTASWMGYGTKKNREKQTEILNYFDQLTNTTSQRAGKPIAGEVDLGTVSFTFQEDASVPAIKQKLIDMEEIPSIVIEDIQGDRAGTVLRRSTYEKVIIVDVQTAIDPNGDGTATVKFHCQKAQWERLTPDGAYAHAIWNPSNL